MKYAIGRTQAVSLSSEMLQFLCERRYPPPSGMCWNWHQPRMNNGNLPGGVGLRTAGFAEMAAVGIFGKKVIGRHSSHRRAVFTCDIGNWTSLGTDNCSSTLKGGFGVR